MVAPAEREGRVAAVPGGGSRCAARLGPASRRELEVSDHELERRRNLDAAEDVIERLEWADGAQEDTPHKRWRDVSRRTALTGGAAGLATLILQACGGGKKESSTGTTAAKAQTGGTPAAGVCGPRASAVSGSVGGGA